MRGAGYGFTAAALMQGALMTEHAARTPFAGDGTRIERQLVLVEPAAGPEPADPPTGTAGHGHSFGLSEQYPECDPRLLRAVDERSRELDARASDLADRARMLEVIEARAREQVEALHAERQALETTLARVDQETAAEITRLVEIYENMKPKDAARIFEAMPAAVAAGFVRRMAEKKSALVMGNLSAEHAYAITLALADSRHSPAEP